MIDLVHSDAATTAKWPDLLDELDRWAAVGRVAALWWRDDDAVTATPQLDTLLHFAGEIPVALAVIPALARPELENVLSGTPGVALLQHGWQHANRARHGKKSEYPEGRSASLVAAEIGAGRARLTALFGPRALPVMVPPWNRIACEFLPLLSANGLAGLSTMATPPGLVAPGVIVPGLTIIDAHVDLVAWRGDRGFIGEGAALGSLVGHLRTSRGGDSGAARPIGILTHHLITDGASVAFLDRLFALTRAHAACRWAAASELFS
jgi:hypothetical protein